jgi:hypothetical protein
MCILRKGLLVCLLVRVVQIQPYSTIPTCQISWKSVQWEPNCSIRTDRHDEANSFFFRDKARVLKKDMFFFIDAAVISTSDWRYRALESRATVSHNQGRCYI